MKKGSVQLYKQPLNPTRWDRFVAPFKRVQSLWKLNDPKGRSAIITNAIIPGVGLLIYKQISKGITHLLVTLLFWVYFSLAGYKHLFGLVKVDYISLPLLALIIIGITVVFWYFFNSYLSKIIVASKEGRPLPKSYFAKKYKEFKNRDRRYWYDFGNTYTQSTKKGRVLLSFNFVLMGFEHLFRKQFVRGIFYAVGQIFYLLYVIFFGWNSMQNLILLGSYVGDRRQVVIYGVLTVVLTLFFVFYYIYSQKSALRNEMRIVAGKKILSTKEEAQELNEDKFYRVSLIVPVLGALVFTVIPLLFMILLAFTNFNMAQSVGQTRFEWTGFQSFRDLFGTTTNLRALINVTKWTFLWAILATFTTYFGGLLLALLLHNKFVKYKGLWRSLFVISLAVPQFISLRVMYSMFDKWGPINTLLLNWNIIGERFDFWGNTTSAKILIVLINMWVGIPSNMLLMSGLLMNIPKDYYEAAALDGASRRQQFSKITFPYIWYMTTPVIITGIVHNMNNFNVIWLLNQGGPSGVGMGGSAGGTDILITWLYKLTMYQTNVSQYNIASAIGIIMFIISASISLVVYRRSTAYKEEDAFR